VVIPSFCEKNRAGVLLRRKSAHLMPVHLPRKPWWRARLRVRTRSACSSQVQHGIVHIYSFSPRPCARVVSSLLALASAVCEFLAPSNALRTDLLTNGIISATTTPHHAVHEREHLCFLSNRRSTHHDTTTRSKARHGPTVVHNDDDDNNNQTTRTRTRTTTDG